MNRIASRIKPKSGFSHFIHLFFTILIPVLVYVFVRWNFLPLALIIILLSKWRMFAVRPRHWWPNIRANAVDITVGISILVFMNETTAATMQIMWAGIYGLWLLFLKPRSGVLMVSLQALVGQVTGLMAVWLAWGNQPIALLVFVNGLICYVTARHFFTNFDEPHAALFAHTWGYFSASLVWVLTHWLLFYGVIAQPTLLLTVIGFGLGGLYYLEQTDRLSVFLRRQFLFIMIAIIVVVLAFSDWGDKTV
jgi:hypothetical protein